MDRSVPATDTDETGRKPSVANSIMSPTLSSRTKRLRGGSTHRTKAVTR
jgi:hypothetical protein